QRGQLFIGPWYSAPDCNCISGESVVRNLLMGHRTASRFGKPMKVGYTPFGWGQQAQLPQIYQGFGIDTAFFYRGISAEDAPRSEYLWESPDGTRVLASRFGCAARYNFYMFIWRPVLYKGRTIGSHLPDRLYYWDEKGVPFKFCDAEHRYDHYFLNAPRNFYDPESLEKYFRKLMEAEKQHFRTAAIPLMQGMDTSMPDPLELELIEKIRAFLGADEEIKISSMPDYVKALKCFLKGQDLPVLKGEMRSPGGASSQTSLTGDIISTRPRQKRLTEKAERMLQRWAEPFSTIAWTLGEEYPERYLEIAWKNLLQCQAHDTIGGCGVDQLERDATYRLNQVVNISNTLMRSALGSLQTRINSSLAKDDEVVLTVFNPSPFPRTEVVEAFVDVPKQTGFIHVHIFDEQGNEIDLYEGRRRDTEKVVRSNVDVTTALLCNELSLQFLAESVPALGYRTYVLKGGGHVPLKKAIATSSHEMENEFLRVEFDDDGTLSVTHKATGKTYEDLHRFEDGGEAGDPWQWKPPAKDRIISSIGCPVQISLEENTHLSATIHVRYQMMIPDSLGHDTSYHDSWRSETEKPLVIDSFFSLRKGSSFLEVETHLDNQHKNHRLRVHFPTRLKAKTASAETSFAVVDREIERGPNSPFRFTYNPTQPTLRFVSLTDGKDGLTLFSDGQREYEAGDDEERTVALTLIRAFEITLCTVTNRWERLPEMELSHAPGKHVFRYAIYPHAGNWDSADVMRTVESFSLPMLSAQTTPCKGQDLPSVKSFLELTPKQLQLSAVKKAERGKDLVVRIYNPTG
ncbi:MAG TPA: glycoside hydrolase family 38 C-terminal domain-containing protein, partial [bacterium]|nr:glycoside hydrolase family 38 C-terminal domain-containing protein [bacterium]